ETPDERKVVPVVGTRHLRKPERSHEDAPRVRRQRGGQRHRGIQRSETTQAAPLASNGGTIGVPLIEPDEVTRAGSGATRHWPSPSHLHLTIGTRRASTIHPRSH